MVVLKFLLFCEVDYHDGWGAVMCGFGECGTLFEMLGADLGPFVFCLVVASLAVWWDAVSVSGVA